MVLEFWYRNWQFIMVKFYKKINNMKQLFNVLLSILILGACRKDKFSKLSSYNGNGLKINGYYYNENNNFYTIYFFYRNGVDINISLKDKYSLSEIDENINNIININSLPNSPSYWGTFIVDQSKIEIEKRVASETLPVYTNRGTIINDTTFILTESYRLKRGKKKDHSTINETYHFRAFSPKPDSTNKYVK
jgi:hypothetical protein